MRRLATCAADVLDACKGRVQVLPRTPTHALRDYGGKTSFEGYVRTVQCTDSNAVVRRMLSQGGPNQVLVIQAPPVFACLGDRLADLAMYHGWEGIVVDGCVRDSAVLRGMSLGVQALGTHPRKSPTYDTGEMDRDVTFGGVVFSPGHYVVCDTDGLVVQES